MEKKFQEVAEAAASEARESVVAEAEGAEEAEAERGEIFISKNNHLLLITFFLES